MSFLVLEDGTVFPGESVAADGRAFGEAVFTTSMSGYQETVTDPSYVGQIVCFTAPMIGNYGIADERSQSTGVHATAVIMRETGGTDWTDWLRERGVVGLRRDRHPLAGTPPPRPGRDARCGGCRRRLRRRGAGRGAGAALDGGGGARRRCLPGGDVHVRDGRRRPRRGRRLRRQALDPAAADRRGGGRRRLPTRRRRRHAGRLRRRVLLGNGPGDPAPLVAETQIVRELARAHARARRVPRPPVARARDRP